MIFGFYWLSGLAYYCCPNSCDSKVPNVTSPADISLFSLSIAALPVLLLLVVYFFWAQSIRQVIYALARMGLQLLAIGYVLLTLFDANHFAWVSVMLLVMISASSWIALGPVKHYRKQLLPLAFIATFVAGTGVLLVIVLGALNPEPWYAANIWIPIAGMLYGNTMNGISLASERFISETERGLSYIESRNKAFSTAMIPALNGMFSVGLVSLPGMMTGQVLSGVSPLLASRYQLIIMLAIFAAAGLAVALFLHLLKKQSPQLISR